MQRDDGAEIELFYYLQYAFPDEILCQSAEEQRCNRPKTRAVGQSGDRSVVFSVFESPKIGDEFGKNSAVSR